MGTHGILRAHTTSSVALCIEVGAMEIQRRKAEHGKRKAEKACWE